MPDLVPLASAFNLAITGDEGEQLVEICNDLVRGDLEPAIVIRITTVLAEIFTDAAEADRVTTKSLLATLGHVCGIMTDTMVSDVSKRARRDTLTGLESRAAWDEDAHNAAEPLVVAMIDLDGLKAVNDGQGHNAGDKYLQRFASDLAGAMPSGAIPYRFGGDEYAVRVSGGSVQELRRTLAELQERSGVAPFSFGIARAPDDGENPGRVLEVADTRMYEMKDNRKAKEGPLGYA